MKWLTFMVAITASGVYCASDSLHDILITINSVHQSYATRDNNAAAVIKDVNSFNNENIIELYLEQQRPTDLYTFCYSHPQRLMECAQYHRREVAINLLYYDMKSHWLPLLQKDIPEISTIDSFGSGKTPLNAFPRTNSARFLYYKWYQWTNLIISDMLVASDAFLSTAMTDLTKRRRDLSDVIVDTIELAPLWQQYIDFFQHYGAICNVYQAWRTQINQLHSLLTTSGLPTESQKNVLASMYVEQGLQAFTRNLLTIVQRYYPHWLNTEHPSSFVERLKQVNLDLSLPILLYQHHIHLINYRDPKIGPLLRKLNHARITTSGQQDLLTLCQQDRETYQICLVIGHNRKPQLLQMLMEAEVKQMISPYLNLINEIRRLEDSFSVREWNRRLQGMYKDLSKYFPMTQRPDELEQWIAARTDILTPTMPLNVLYDYFHERSKYIWIQCFDFLINDLAFWRQEVSKAAHIIDIYQKKRKPKAHFDIANCQVDHSLYTCIASLHTFVYSTVPDKLTANKHYHLYGDINKLNADIKLLVGENIFFAGLKQYNTIHPKEITASTKKSKYLPTVLGSAWSSDSSSDELVRRPRIQRSLTSIASPRKMYKAIGRAISEK